MPGMTSPRRPSCARCLRPLSTCLCARVVPVAHATRALILQHPLEVLHAKGTGRLLHLSLTHSQLEVGERFDDARLAAWLGPSAALLYPADEAGDARPGRDGAWHRPPACVTAPQTLVVLDATWRKSRLMLHLNPRLQALPRVSLHAPPPSRYAMRRAHRPAQRSTLEATLAALEQLDGAHPAHAALLASLDALVGDWQAAGSSSAADPLCCAPDLAASPACPPTDDPSPAADAPDDPRGLRFATPR